MLSRRPNSLHVFLFSHGLDCDVDCYAVNNYVGFSLMDASTMVSLAANWSTMPNKSSCTIERIGVRKYVENVLFHISEKKSFN